MAIELSGSRALATLAQIFHAPISFSILVCVLFTNAPTNTIAAHAFKCFVTVKDGQLFDGDEQLRFISWNVPNLHYIEDNLAFDELNAFRWPDLFEITDALVTVRQMGGQVVRTYALAVRRTNDPPDKPCHVFGPGKFNEDGFRALDMVLKVANEQGVRLIIPFIDNWSWWGGVAEYAKFRGKPKEAFWTDPQLIADFKELIRYLLLRTNTLTGVRYCDDKAILCWETGNELDSTPNWTREIARFIKSIDTNHLVMDGANATVLRDVSLHMPEIDIVTTHHYPGRRTSFAQLIRQNAAKAKAQRKPYIIGEFGFVDTHQIEAAIKAIIESGAAGGLLWSLRFRNRDGGFYWHSEPAGGNRYKAFHWPGSSIAAAYDELNLMQMVRFYAFKIRGSIPPELPVPDPPKMIPPKAKLGITWQGSVGAAAYIVERAPSPNGPWNVVGTNIDECFVQYRPLFVDESAEPGQWYYRVRAVNAAGVSAPSPVFGPVEVKHKAFVDELSDLRRVYSISGKLEPKTDSCRQAKEDAHRVAGAHGATLVYRMPGTITAFRIFAFHPDPNPELKIRLSVDGISYHPVTYTKTTFYTGPGDYNYWVPTLYEAQNIDNQAQYLQIEFMQKTQLGRVEILYAPK